MSSSSSSSSSSGQQQQQHEHQLHELCERHDWDGVRDRLLLRLLVVDHHQKITSSSSSSLSSSFSHNATTITYNDCYDSIQYVLKLYVSIYNNNNNNNNHNNNRNNNENDDEDDDNSLNRLSPPPPFDILSLLFDVKRRSQQEEVERTNHESSTMVGSPYYGLFFVTQLCDDVCCEAFANKEVLFQLPIPVLKLILTEHSKVYPTEHDKEGRHRCKVITSMWRKTMFQWQVNIGGRTGGKGNRFVLKESAINQLFAIQSLDDLVNHPSNAELYDLWQRTCLFLQRSVLSSSCFSSSSSSSSATTKKEEEEPMLHVAVKNGCPIVAVWLIIKLYPEQLHQQDTETGRTVLHYAYERPLTIGFSNSDKLNGIVNKPIFYDSSPDYKALASHPSYVSFLVSQIILSSALSPSSPDLLANCQDKNYKLPLTTYLENRCYDLTPPIRFMSDIDNLLQASGPSTNVVTLSTPDQQSGLLPFMIPTATVADIIVAEAASAATAGAAVSEMSSSSQRYSRYPGYNHRIHTTSLTITYHLLRKDPSVLLNIT